MYQGLGFKLQNPHKGFWQFTFSWALNKVFGNFKGSSSCMTKPIDGLKRKLP